MRSVTYFFIAHHTSIYSKIVHSMWHALGGMYSENSLTNMPYMLGITWSNIFML